MSIQARIAQARLEIVRECGARHSTIGSGGKKR